MTDPARTTLQRLYDEQGQSPWVDNIERSWLSGGRLASLVAAGVRGLTSNPTIFAKAVEGSGDYDEQLARLGADTDPLQAYWELVAQDIRGALDVLAPLHEESSGSDGFASIEVAPSLAHDTEGTIAAARDLHRDIDRPNLLVKIPATAEGVPAIRQLISEGRSINVTLIFSLQRYSEVAEAYISGLEALAAADPGADLSRVASVASFFVSRVDTEVDRRLEELANGRADLMSLRGKAAVAQAKLAYRLFREHFDGQRWQALARRGARVQRPLWASTSTKNPAYPDLLYVDSLIGPDTVNTMPENTLEAYLDHGRLAGATVTEGVEEAEAALRALARSGVDLDDVAQTLEDQGVASFVKSFDELVQVIADKAGALAGGAGTPGRRPRAGER